MEISPNSSPANKKNLSSVDHPHFYELFQIEGGKENRKFQTWHKIGKLLNVKNLAKTVEDIKDQVNRKIQGLEWKDLEEIQRVTTLKKMKLGKTEALDLES